MDADSSYGGSDTAQDSHSAHELSTASSPTADHAHLRTAPADELTTTAVHVIGPPPTDDLQPPQQFYHKNEITVPVNVDQTDFQRSPRLPHYLATAKLNIGESLEHHSNLEEMSRNYRSSSRLNESPPPEPGEGPFGGGGVENPAFVDDAPPIESTFKPSSNGDGQHGKGHGRDASSLNGNEEPPTEAVNLELINLRPNKNGSAATGEPYDAANGMTTIPLKKEADRDVGNPYDEYFVPVNEHRKYMRGEKLYVTKDNRVEKSRSKYICWIVCVCLAVAALIIGILAAVGVIGNQGPLPQEVSARSFDGGNQTPISKGSISLPGGPPPASPEPPISTLPPIPPTTDTSRIEVPRAIESELKIDNLQFNSQLADANSSEFKALAETLRKQLMASLFDENTLQYGPADIEVRIMEFTPGSVIVKYRIGWSFKEGIHAAKDPLDPASLRRKLTEALQRNDSLMGAFHVSQDSLKANRIIDRCRIENDGCEHECLFDYELLDFVCLCPTGMESAGDGKSCVQIGSSGSLEEDLGHSRNNFHDYDIPAEVEHVPSAQPEPINELQPELEPTAEPKSSAEPEPAAEPEPTAEPEPAAEPSAEPEPAAEPSAEPELTAEPSAEPEPTAEPSVEPEPTAEPSVEPEPAAVPEPSAEPEPAAKPEPSAEPEPTAEAEPTAEPTPSRFENIYLGVNKNKDGTESTTDNQYVQNSSETTTTRNHGGKESGPENYDGLEESTSKMNQQTSTHENIIMAVVPLEHTTSETEQAEIPQNDLYYDPSVVTFSKAPNETQHQTTSEHATVAEEDVSHDTMLDMGPEELERTMHEMGVIRVVTPVAEVITTSSLPSRFDDATSATPIAEGITPVADTVTTQSSNSQNMQNIGTEVRHTTPVEMSFSEIHREPKIQELHMYQTFDHTGNQTADGMEHPEEYMSPFLPDLENDTFINSLHSDDHFVDRNNLVDGHATTKPPSLDFDQLNHTNPFDNDTSDGLGVEALEEAKEGNPVLGGETTTLLPTTMEAVTEGGDTGSYLQTSTSRMDDIGTDTTTTQEDITTIEALTENNIATTTNDDNVDTITDFAQTTVINQEETTTQSDFDIGIVSTSSNDMNDTEAHPTEHASDINSTETSSQTMEQISTTTLPAEISTIPSEILNNVHSDMIFDRQLEIDEKGRQDGKNDQGSTKSVSNFSDLSSSTEDLIALETTTNIFRAPQENMTQQITNEATTINAEVIETSTEVVDFIKKETNEISSPPTVYQVEEKVRDFTTTEKLFVSPKPTFKIPVEEKEEEADLSVIPLGENAREASNEISEESQVSSVGRISNELEKQSRIIEDKPVTEDFELPKFARCRIGQFQCANGTSVKDGKYCIANSDRCDSISDCTDGSDEVHCEEEGCPNNFQCASKQCLKRHLVCDGILNCNDGSDEINCESWTCNFDEVSCGASQRCIPISWKCDGRAHCLDGSDEHNCHPNSCSDESFHCSEQGSCIPASWRCDGKQDCAAGEDEKLCDCSNEEFKCALGGGCLPKTSRCDGIEHCADKSDEWNCLRLDFFTNSSNAISDKKILQIQAENSTWYPVCMDWALWNTTYADMACRNLGYVGSTSLESVPMPVGLEFDQVYQLKSSHGNTFHLERKNDGKCNQFASISCQEYVCGSLSSFDLPSARIVGGNKAAPSQWPSLGLLYDKKHNTFCTATLVTPLWAIASYSCVLANAQSATDWIFYAGGTNKMDNSSIQMRAVQKVVAHPKAKFSQFEFVNDVVLLKLKKPMNINVNVSASCLPEKDMEPRQLCIVTGWGVNQPGDLANQQYLYYLPVPMMDAEECNSTKHYNSRLSDDKICAGYADSKKTPCSNDEGAPLLCFSDETSNWELRGILSHHDNCGSNKHPAVFTKIDSTMKSWIANTIGGQAFGVL